jgi:hypothetical protein
MKTHLGNRADDGGLMGLDELLEGLLVARFDTEHERDVVLVLVDGGVLLVFLPFVGCHGR